MVILKTFENQHFAKIMIILAKDFFLLSWQTCKHLKSHIDEIIFGDPGTTAHSFAEVWFHNACRSLVSRGGGLRSSLSPPRLGQGVGQKHLEWARVNINRQKSFTLLLNIGKMGC